MNNGLPKLNCEIVPCGDEAAWLNERRKRVQASEAAAVLGESAWGSPLSLWQEKTSPAPLVNGSTERLQLGRELESPIRTMYRRKFGGKVHEWPAWTIAVSREHGYLGCTPDGLCEDKSRPGVGILEIKTASEFSRRDWQESVPLAYQIQVQTSLAVTGLNWGVIAVLIGVTAIERYFVERNDRFIAEMLPLLEDFAVCIDLRTPPAVDGSAATTRALARLHPDDNGLAVRLPYESDKAINKLRRVRSLLKRCETRKSELENELRSMIADNTFGVTPAGQWLSWKSQSRGAVQLEPCTFRVLRECKEPREVAFADAPAEIDFKVAGRSKIPAWIKVKLLNQHPRCKWCGCQLTSKTATLEHLVPLSRGGTNDEHNLALACRACNEKRGDNAAMEVSHAR